MSNSPSNAAARILAQHRAMSGKTIICDICGGQHFYEVQVTKYLSGGSGSVEILPDTTDQTFPLLRCAGCNFPVVPKVAVGRRHGGVYESAHKEFRESVIKGQDYLKSESKSSIKAEVLEAAAGVGMEASVANLNGRVDKIEDSLRKTKAVTSDATTK